MAVALIRAKASRPNYRRAGLMLSSTAWLEIDPRELDEGRLGALAGDPVVLLQGQDEGGWRDIPAEVRAAATAALAEPSEASSSIVGGPTWDDVDEARRQVEARCADELANLTTRLVAAEGEIEVQRDLVGKALAAKTKAEDALTKLQGQFDALKAQSAARAAKVPKTGPADPPAADQA